jgi:hypothetical protein
LSGVTVLLLLSGGFVFAGGEQESHAPLQSAADSPESYREEEKRSAKTIMTEALQSIPEPAGSIQEPYAPPKPVTRLEGDIGTDRRFPIPPPSVKTGNFQEDAKNEIRQRNAWLTVLKECEDFYRGRIPAEIVYDPVLYPVSAINFKTETQDFAANVEIRPTRDAQSMLRDIQYLRSGLDALGHRKLTEWSPEHDELWLWPNQPDKPPFFANNISGKNRYGTLIGVQASLINENGKILGTSFVLLDYIFEVDHPKPIKLYFGGESKIYSGGDAKIWSTGGSSGGGTIYTLASFQFKNIAIKDMTDPMTVKITHVALLTGNNHKDPVYSHETITNLNRKFWTVVDSETAGKTGLLQISAGAVRSPTRTGYYQRTLTADTDREEIK